MDRSNPLLSLLFAIAVIIFTITFSIALPIYVRPFYYAHIPSVQNELKEEYDIDVEQDLVKEAYDEVLDFLTLPGREFGTGKLKFSEDGKGHFEDCKFLFDLNTSALIASFAVIIILGILNKCGTITLSKPFGLPLTFWAGIGTLLLFAILGFAVTQDFSSAFTKFHKIFFPGKTNWVFDPSLDPIILFMPQRFFMNCAILICASMLIISVMSIVRGIRNRD